MTLFLVLVTEGVALLQPTSTSEEKRVGLKYHALIQSTAYLATIIGFSFIFYNKIISKKAHFESLHGKLGLFVFIYLLIQVFFGITIGLMPNTFYKSTNKAKSLWKYHRVFGYILLLLVWFTAQLGIRADYIYNNMYSPHLVYLHWVSLLLVSVGLISRTRTSKWGIRL
ncbi:eukaryotic cytochrome b561-domain-containing protein [Sporodiniella umbellata]|nr:eukaryotic cytochrome b561-domain-containing protein [Sporodiniella umbellata]